MFSTIKGRFISTFKVLMLVPVGATVGFIQHSSRAIRLAPKGAIYGELLSHIENTVFYNPIHFMNNVEKRNVDIKI